MSQRPWIRHGIMSVSTALHSDLLHLLFYILIFQVNSFRAGEWGCAYSWRSWGDCVHCNENTIYVFLFWKLRGLSRNFHIYTFVRDLYSIFPGSVHTFGCSKIDSPILGIYKISHRYMSVGIGSQNIIILFWK
jgi:hypothetical protein